jgi:uncharacterized protein (DUF1778 family)
MTKKNNKRQRLSIDILPEEHRQIKAYAALYGRTIREYVLRCIREHLSKEAKKKELSDLTTRLDQDPVLRKLWDNERDSAYDSL